MKTIYFIRHGQTKYNLEGKFVGSTDLPLSEDGRKQIFNKWDGVQEHIERDIIFTSPMKRCVETTGIIFPYDSFEVLKNMREMNFGMFEGKTHDELEYIEEYRYFRETKGRAKIPKGESGIEFSMRVLKAFFEMIAYMDKKDANNAVLVCHGGVIMSLFSMLCHESDDIYYYHVDNGSGYKAHYNQYTKELIIIEKL